MKHPFILTIAIAAAVVITLKISNRTTTHPQVGDIYACYYDRRTDQYALTNGLPAESIGITKIVKVENGTVYAAIFYADISELKGFGTNYNMWGPAAKYRTYKQYYTLLTPIRN